MDSVEFVKAIKILVRDNAIIDIIENLETPPGRRPAQELIELSVWYNNMRKSDKSMLRRIISMAVDTSIFGMLAVIDGVRTIEETTEGNFELNHVLNGKIERLNKQEDEYLHDLFQQEISG